MNNDAPHPDALQYAASLEDVGPLQARVIKRPGDFEPTHIICLCHGYGAGGDDLAGLADIILAQTCSDDFRPVLYFPHAPIDMTPHGLSGGRAWWLLNMAKLLEATEKGTFDELRAEKPDGLEDAAEKLAGAIAVMRSSWPTCQDRLLLGGFSQGAMMSMEVSTQKLDEPPIGMALFSGALINEASWRSGASKIAETAIFQSHGTLDNVLPFQTGEWLREMLESSDCNVDFIAFDGFHEIPAPAIAGMLRAFGSETE